MATVIEVNCETGETIEREQTPEEVAQAEAMAAQALADAAARQAEADAKAAQLAATNAKLIGLGLTQADIDALLNAAKG